MFPKLIAKIILKAEQKWTSQVIEKKVEGVLDRLDAFVNQVGDEYNKLKEKENGQ